MPENIGDNRVVLDGIAQITPQDAERLGRYRVRPGDIVYSRRGDVERRALIRPGEDGWLCGTGCLRVRFGQGHVNPTFASYYLGDARVREWIVRHAHGATMPNLNSSILSALPFVLAPLPEQHAVAHILGTLDDKIELNRRMNKTLEAMARALFRSWFVDFDPVRAKAEGRNPGLPPGIAELFPDRLQESDLGETPVGWRYCRLGDLIDLTRGRTYKSSLKGLPGPVLLGLGSIERNGGFRDDNLSTYGGDSPAGLVLGPGELFASLKDVTQSADLLGAVARVPAHVPCGRLTQDTVRLNFRPVRASRRIVYRTLLSPRYRDYCRSYATGTTNLGLSRDDFLAYPIMQPSEGVQRAFEQTDARVEACAASAVAESRTLAALRDTLLPKLISGQVRLRDAERIVEAAS
jgi:type I restriction enzyme S subunit